MTGGNRIMQSTDFYTGEPVETGSPPNSAENEAAAMASFGKYDYDPGMRQQVYQPTTLMPGSYGYTYGGIGMPPPGYNPYGNPQPSYRQFMGGNGAPYYGQPNPAFSQQQQYNYYQQQYNPPKTYTIPGLRPFGEYMPTAGWEDQLSAMQMDYFNQRVDQEVKQEVDQLSNDSPYGYGGGWGYNYYGAPYWNPYRYNSINQEFQRKIDQMKDEARENQMEFTMRIARLAHNFTHQYISEEALRERYTGKVVDIPAAYQAPVNYDEYVRQQRLNNLVPFDNSGIYRAHRAKVQREFREIIPEDSDLKETFSKMGIIESNWELEEEQHRRKDASNSYNSSDNSYKHYVRQKAKERYAAEKGVILPGSRDIVMNTTSPMSSYVESSPVLSQVANLADDGTLNVSISLPQNIGNGQGSTYTVHNSQEAEYDEKRARFGQFLGSIKGSITLDQQKANKLENYNYG